MGANGSACFCRLNAAELGIDPPSIVRTIRLHEVAPVSHAPQNMHLDENRYESLFALVQEGFFEKLRNDNHVIETDRPGDRPAIDLRGSMGYRMRGLADHGEYKSDNCDR